MTYSLTWLPQVLTDAGLKVAECQGWETRGRGDVGTIKGVMCHHTATPTDRGNMPTLNTLINGRADLQGPLSQLGLGRDGTYYIIAAGRCNHAGRGMWQGVISGNSSFIGIEAENGGISERFPWPQIQLDAYYHGTAAILRHIGKGAEYCAGHKEYALPHGRKPDPNLDMNNFRSRITGILTGTTPILQPIPAFEPQSGGNRPRATVRRGIANDAALVKIIQAKVGATPDGFFGPKTEAAVRDFQRRHNAVPDGIVGPKTWALIDKN